jgi:hypothetical protein
LFLAFLEIFALQALAFELPPALAGGWKDTLGFGL